MPYTRPNPDACIACTTCVVHCPVAQATPNFLGPRLIGPAWERFRPLPPGFEEPSLHYCANCKNCDITCPHQVPVSTFNMLARAAQCQKQRLSLRDWMVAHGEVMARALGCIPAVLRNVGMLNPVTRQMLHLLGVHKRSPLPAFAGQTFRKKFRTLRQPASQRQVVFFPGCYVDIYDPQTGLDMVWALNQAGYEVLVPEAFRCCGLPMIANGFWQDARGNAATNVAELRRWKAAGIPVLTGCPSCALMLTADLPEYFPELVPEECASSVEDAQEFLLRAVRRGDWDLSKARAQARAEERILYHPPCHLRAQGLGLPGLELLQSLAGVSAFSADTVRPDATCCGISGSYGFKKEKYDIAMRIGRPLFEAVQESRATLTASECGTCRVQVEHGTGKKCLHPVSIVRRCTEGL